MPITRITPRDGIDSDVSLDVFHIQEAFEVYDGSLALAIDHLLNHVKTLISLAYLPGSKDLDEALDRHPILSKVKRNTGTLAKHSLLPAGSDGRSPERVLLNECQRLLLGVLEISYLAAWPETAGEARARLEELRNQVPFLDYRYDNDPYPSDKDHED